MRNYRHFSLFSAVSMSCLLGIALLAGIRPVAAAPEAVQKPAALRVCQDPQNLPFSNEAHQGFENKIAELFGHELGVPVEYTWFPQRMGFIRKTLKARERTPDGGVRYKCDLVVGVPAGSDMAATTKPYYHSTYALVYVKGRHIHHVATEQDFLKQPPEVLKHLKIAVFDRSPATDWLLKYNLADQMVTYSIMTGDPQQYPGEILQHDLASGKIDAAIIWGPIAGYFATKDKAVDMVVVPMQSEPGIKFDYQMAMAVRYREPQWKQTIQHLIDQDQGKINQLLADYHVPMLPLQPVRAH